MASPALAAQVSPPVLAAAQAFWAEYNQGQSPCSSVTVTYFDGPVLATDEPLHNGEASIGHPASSFHGAPVSQPCDLRFSRLLAGRSLAYQCAVAAHEIGHAGMGLEHTSDRTNVMFKYTIVPRFCRQAFLQRVGSRRGCVDHDCGIAMMRGLIYDTPPDLELIRSRGARITPLVGAPGARATPAAWPVRHAVEEAPSGRGCRSGVLGSAGLWRQPRQGAPAPSRCRSCPARGGVDRA